MDLDGFKFVMFINSILVIGAVPSFTIETDKEYTLIMPLTDDGTQIPLTLNSSFAENWCSSIGATLPRITNETEQKVITNFIQSATQNYTFDRMQNIFVNNIIHTVGDWSWVNGQTYMYKGSTVEAASSTRNEGYLFGYLSTTDHRIHQSRSDTKRSICETLKPSNKYGRCDMKFDNKCYWKKDVSLTWYKARSDCVDEGGDLVSFDAVNETGLNDSLKNLSLNVGASYWVGLFKGTWRWNDKGKDSEIKYNMWKPEPPPDYNATCLCLNKSSSYEWIQCDCDKQYPFICKRSVISETSTQNLPMDQTVRLAPVLSSCVLIVIVILVIIAFIIRKQRNRPLSSTRYKSFMRETTTNTMEIPAYVQVQRSTINESTANWSASDTAYANVESFRPLKPNETSEPMTTATANVIPIYAKIEKAAIIQSTANWSASNTEYANVQPVETYNAEYAELDELEIK